MPGSIGPVTKAAASVSEMAKLCGLSRARFYQLQREGIFPTPVFDIKTRRPCYLEEDQRRILEARHRNCGVNGKTILFYAPRGLSALRKPGPRQGKPSAVPMIEQHTELTDALKALGMNVTAEQMAKALREGFPQGTVGVDEGDQIRQVFLHIRRQDSADNVRR